MLATVRKGRLVMLTGVTGARSEVASFGPTDVKELAAFLDARLQEIVLSNAVHRSDPFSCLWDAVTVALHKLEQGERSFVLFGYRATTSEWEDGGWQAHISMVSAVRVVSRDPNRYPSKRDALLDAMKLLLEDRLELDREAQRAG